MWTEVQLEHVCFKRFIHPTRWANSGRRLGREDKQGSLINIAEDRTPRWQTDRVHTPSSVSRMRHVGDYFRIFDWYTTFLARKQTRICSPAKVAVRSELSIGRASAASGVEVRQIHSGDEKLALLKKPKPFTQPLD